VSPRDGLDAVAMRKNLIIVPAGNRTQLKVKIVKLVLLLKERHQTTNHSRRFNGVVCAVLSPPCRGRATAAGGKTGRRTYVTRTCAVVANVVS